MTLQHGPQPHAPAPHPYEYRGTRTCDQCGCRWKMDDLSEPNPIDDLCREPVKWHPKKCLCHSEPYVTGLLDLRDRLREEVVGAI
jgi:hypothetical protein